MTCSMTPKSLCWHGVRCSLADSTSKAPARWPDPMTSTTTPSWICWTRWCASRCWSPTDQPGGPGSRCWRRSASSPRSNSSPAATPPRSATAHARYFAGRETDILALWDSPRQREAYNWFTVELANLRTAFRWAADHDDLDVAAAIATYASFLGLWVEQYEPIAWAEELIEPARAVDHPRLGYLYSDGIPVLDGRTDRSRCPLQRSGSAGSWQWPRAGAVRPRRLARRRVHGHRPVRAVGRVRAAPRSHAVATRTVSAGLHWSLALAFAGSGDEAMAAANGLIDAAEATNNPCVLSFALLAYGSAFRDADPDRALNALRRGLAIAQDSGNRYTETHLAAILCRVEAEHGDPLVALDYFTLAIRNYHDSGNTTAIRSPLAVLAAFLDRLGRYEPAATIAGFAFSPLTAWTPEVATAIAHLRDVLGDQTYESLARKGETMTTAAMATYAYDQIDQARAELNAVSK